MILDTKFKSARLEKKLTQKELANLVGISERQYIRIEKGERIPDAITTIRIANVLGISDIRKLFGGA